MSGHNKWSKIKRKKAATDKEKSKIYSKHAKAISRAAKKDPNPETNQKLRRAIEQAEEDNVPKDNIKDAVERARESAENTETLQIEAYGPAGVAILIIAETNNKNRTVSEIKHLLSDSNGKWADPGSVLWNFEEPASPGGNWAPKFPQEISGGDKEKLENLVENIKNHEDVEEIYTSAK